LSHSVNLRCSATGACRATILVLALAWVLGTALPAGAEPDRPAAPPPADAGAILETKIVYLGKQYREPPPLSLVDVIANDKGVQGARIALDEVNTTGRLTNQHFELKEAIAREADDVVEMAREVLAAGHRFIVADLDHKDLLAVSDLATKQAPDAILLNIRESLDALRMEDCRANVFHIPPSSSMRTDALAQYLSWKRWRRWFLISGKSERDLEYAAAVRRTAKKLGAKIVEERSYEFDAGSRRTDSGHQQIQTQMPMLTQGAEPHDVVFVADVSEAFGDYLQYRTSEP
jgi:ABC transporter substrate binding protein (PQQ-dependent alcohol dehydrogenase system)